MIISQGTGNHSRTAAAGCHLKNPAHHRSGFLVNDPVVFLLRVFFVAVNHLVRDWNARLGSSLISRPLLSADVPQIKLVHNIEEWDIFAGCLIKTVDPISDGDETDFMLPEKYINIKSGLQVIAPHTAHILHNHRADLVRLNIRDHLFPCRALKSTSRPTVIRIMDTVSKTMRIRIVLEVSLLIGYGIAVTCEVVIAGKALIQSCDFFFRLPDFHAGTPSRLRRLICGTAIVSYSIPFGKPLFWRFSSKARSF